MNEAIEELCPGSKQFPHVETFFRQAPVRDSFLDEIQVVILDAEFADRIGRMGGHQFFLIVFRHHRRFQVPERPFRDFLVKGDLQIFVGEFRPPPTRVLPVTG